jgi:hypothetical protein
VVIEAKMENNTDHALAQVLGYTAAFSKDVTNTPIGLVITQRCIRLVVFLFTHQWQLLITENPHCFEKSL